MPCNCGCECSTLLFTTGGLAPGSTPAPDPTLDDALDLVDWALSLAQPAPSYIVTQPTPSSATQSSGSGNFHAVTAVVLLVVVVGWMVVSHVREQQRFHAQNIRSQMERVSASARATIDQAARAAVQAANRNSGW